jgi:hypothetical protein
MVISSSISYDLFNHYPFRNESFASGYGQFFERVRESVSMRPVVHLAAHRQTRHCRLLGPNFQNTIFYKPAQSPFKASAFLANAYGSRLEGGGVSP